jgi:flagellar assembly protein FliH
LRRSRNNWKWGRRWPPPPPPSFWSHPKARQEGYDEGHAAGHADGHAEAGRRPGTRNCSTARAGRQLRHALQGADQLIANEVLDLALQLAKGMLKNALQVKPELILPIVRDAIEYLPVLQQPALLVLHPDDAATVRAGIGEELDKGGWRVVEDPSVGRGGCKVDTASNQIDATAAARWQRLSHALGKEVDWLA